jgi:hypothetical protein
VAWSYRRCLAAEVDEGAARFAGDAFCWGDRNTMSKKKITPKINERREHPKSSLALNQRLFQV